MRSMKGHITYWLIILLVGYAGYYLFTQLAQTKADLDQMAKQQADSVATIKTMTAAQQTSKKEQAKALVAQQDKPLPLFFMDASVEQPNVDNFGIQVWANLVAVRAYSYDFMNLDAQFSHLRRYFIPAAWDKFKAALDTAGITDLVKTQKLVASAVAMGAVVVNSSSVKDGVFQWDVVMPLRVRFANATQQIEQRLNLSMTLVRTTGSSGVMGIAVHDFTAVKLPDMEAKT